MAETFFITGTDTGVGKTHVSCEILRALNARGRRVCGFKPVASGCVCTSDGLCNEDALALQAAAGTHEPYDLINPYAFVPPLAPHIAAAQASVVIEPLKLDAAHAQLASRYEQVWIEGAGGWRVPLNDTAGFDDWVASHRWPVVLVVGMRLGCINHALLTAESILRRTTLRGWIANPLPPAMDALQENIRALEQRMPAPRLTSDSFY